MASNLQKWSAELVGTFWLTFGGCGSAVLAAAFPQVGIGLLGVSLAFGLTVVTGAYALGPVSGGHFNPAVSVGLAVAGRFPAAQLPGYILAQVLGAIAAAALLYVVASGQAGALVGDLATNGFGAHSPGRYSMTAALVVEVVLTAVFLVVILGATAPKAAAGFGGVPDADPPDLHPGDQHLGQSGAQHRAGAVRSRDRAGAAVAVLAGADGRCGPGGAAVPGVAGRRARSLKGARVAPKMPGRHVGVF